MKKDWIVVKLGEIAEIISGRNQKEVENPNGKYPIYGSGGIFGNADNYLCPPGTTVIGRKGTINNPIFVNEKFWNVDTAFGIHPNEYVLPQFLFYFCKGFNFKKLDKSTTIPSLAKRDLLQIDFHLPPLPEQRAIVSRIEELFSELDHSIANLKSAQAKLEIYRQAVLKKAFEGGLTEEWRKEHPQLSSFDFLTKVSKFRKQNELPKESVYKKKVDYNFNFSKSNEIPTWANATLDKLIYIAARIGWRGLKKDEYTDSGPFFLSVHSLNFGKYVDFSQAFHISIARYDESPEIKLIEGDVLLCKDGAGIGKLAIVKGLKSEATVNSSLLVIRGMDILNQDFIYYLFSGPGLQKIVFERITGSATPHLFQNDIRKFDLLVPPPEEQTQIVQEIESRLSVADKMAETIETNLKKSESLRQSILKRAFEGKLLSEAELEACRKEADWEPAERLLGRVISEKTKIKKK